MNEATNVMEIRDLCKSYPGFSLSHLNLTLPGGCIMGLVGENGAGKSTTIKLLCDMIRRDSGTITLLGRDNRDNPRLLKEELGVVLDEVGFPSCLNARQIGKIMERSFRSWDTQAYDALLRRLGVPQEKPFKDLSRGMKMKQGIAVALSHHARLLLLDEATAGLDPVVRDDVLELFSEFTRDARNAVLISSHIVSDLEKICDYIAFLHKGELLLCEEKDALRERYGLLHLTHAQLEALPAEAIVGKRENAYGAEVIAEKAAIPAGMTAGPVDIEQLFVFMVRQTEGSI